MNYIWDVLFKADEQGIKRDDIKFVWAEVCSPYMEISSTCLNSIELPENNIVEINPCYRFHNIFKDLFNINLQESSELREVLLDILLHYLADIDIKQGLCKTEFYKEFLKKDILNGVFGKELADNIKLFKKEEMDYILSGLITLYKTGLSLHLFNKILRKVFKNNIVYINKDKIKDMYIYLAQKKSDNLKIKIDIIIELFLPINMNVLIFWDNHFGILGFNNTMKIDEIVMVK